MNPHRERAIQVAARYGVWSETLDVVRGCFGSEEWTTGHWLEAILAQDRVARHREGEPPGVSFASIPVDAYHPVD